MTVMETGLSEDVVRFMTNVFAENPNIKKVILYGSRAKGTFKPFSDVDITLVGGRLSYSDIRELLQRFDESNIPYSFDISVFSQLKNDDLVKHINRVGLVIYEKV